MAISTFKTTVLISIFVQIAVDSALSDESAQPDREARVAWLKRHAIPLRSIDPGDEDFSDLEPLRAAIGNARIVQLGEQSHGDGATFHAKARLIKFLHQKMDFDVLAFESGLYDCRKAWESLERGEKPLEAFQQGVFGIWTGSEQVQPLIHYVGKAAASNHPLELCGFDCQFTAAASRMHLSTDVTRVLDQLPKESLSVEDRPAVLALLADILKGQTTRPLPAEIAAKASKTKPAQDVVDAQRKALAAWAEALAGAKPTGALSAGEIAFWKQYVESLAAEAENHWAGRLEPMEGSKRRDRQMAKNLVWLARDRYPNRKIIVWAASFHLARNPRSIQPTGQMPADFYRDAVTMGDEVWKELGNMTYTLGFLAADGSFGRFGATPVQMPAAQPGSVEDLLVAAGQQNAIVDFRGLDDSGAWLRQRLAARPLGYAYATADWSNVFDGLVFTRTMFPSSLAAHLKRPDAPAQSSMRRPADWGFPPLSAAGYEFGLDSDVKHGGTTSGYLKSISDPPRGFGNTMQMIAADNFRGKRVRLSAFLKTEGVKRSTALWMRVDGVEKMTIAFDNMSNRQIKGTNDWKEYQIVLDVPDEAADITFGLMLVGTGRVWTDDLKLDIVGNDVPTTAIAAPSQPRPGKPIPNLPKEPTNLDFEK